MNGTGPDETPLTERLNTCTDPHQYIELAKQLVEGKRPDFVPRLVELVEGRPLHEQDQLIQLQLPVFKCAIGTMRRMLKDRAKARKAEEVAAKKGAPTEPTLTEEQIGEFRLGAEPFLSGAVADKTLAETRLDVIGDALKEQGWGGDIKPAKLAYLAMTSRVLAKRPGTLPCHTQVNAPSGMGKSWLVECTLGLYTEDMAVVYDAGSQKLIVHDPVSYRHKILVLSEADSLPGVNRKGDDDNAAVAMVKVLLAKGEAKYKYPVRDPETGGFTIMEVVKEGPTALITTSVRRVRNEQLDSRLFRLKVPDDPGQQKLAMAARAKAEKTAWGRPDPPKGLVAFQQYLQALAPIDVVVPFVDAFNDLLTLKRIDARLLRDAERILSFIKSVTLLCLDTRDRQPATGRYIATYEDYHVVYALMDDMYEDTATGASTGVRDLVAEVTRSPYHSMSEYARRLDVSQKTISLRAATAIEHGWLANTETRSGHPAKLSPGDPLPHKCGLPTVAQLKAWKGYATAAPTPDAEVVR